MTPNGNLLQQTDPLGNVTTYTYNTSGNMLSMTDPLGNAKAIPTTLPVIG
ncbi:MAG: RHS repeat domain-containing protein [Caldilineaceae bacterium]